MEAKPKINPTNCFRELMGEPGAGRPEEKAQAQALSRSPFYQDYARAFARGTGLPLALQGRESFWLVRYPPGHENPFCAVICRTSRACAACYALQQKLEKETGQNSRTLKCFAGFCESAVPVRVRGNVVAFLHTGQVLLHAPTRAEFRAVTEKLRKWGVKMDLRLAKRAYLQTRVLRPGQYRALLRLLEMFALQLGASALELPLEGKANEPAAVARAREFIASHHTEPLSLAQVAKAVNMSVSYFSARFKNSTGMTFTDYVAHCRVAGAQKLLKNPRLTVSEVAYEAGFGSLSQFNRTFKRLTGCAPTKLRFSR